MNARRRDTAAAWLLLLVVDLVVRSGGFRRVHRMVERIPVRKVRALAEKPDVISIVNDAVDRAAVWYPRRMRCLPRSVVATWLLRRRGVEATFVIGVRKIPFYAHAWVEVDGRVVNDAASVQVLYPAIDRLVPGGGRIMSAFGGVLLFDGAPADAAELAALGAGLERFGGDGGRDVVAGPVGMAYRAFHTNAESRRERQPYCQGHQTLLCWNGRLDNREELLRHLRHDLRGDETDPALVMSALVRWRNAGLARLVGDFALALWDGRDHALWLARDGVGTRPLYYRIDGACVRWSTDLDVLVDFAGTPPAIDDEYIAGFLTREPEPGQTPYVGVHAVKPGHVVRVDGSGLVSEQIFWELDPTTQLRYRTDGEYEEHFRALFREAVRVRLRADRPVFAELSGGLDSSSIVCMADDILRAGETPAQSLETVSHLFDRSTSSDETTWIRHVEAHRGRAGHHILESQIEFMHPSGEDRWMTHPASVLTSSGYIPEVSRLMRHGGSRVLLSGLGGDQLIHATNNPTGELRDLAAAGKWLDLHRRTLLWSRTIKEPYSRVLWMRGVRPLLPPFLQFQSRQERDVRLPDCVDRRLVEIARARQRRDLRRRGPRALPSALYQKACFESAIRWIADGYRQADTPGVELSFPYLHRPLVEFLQQIPFEQKIRPGQSRSILRRSLEGILPAATLRRRGKGNPSEAMCRAFAEQSARVRPLLDDSRCAALGYIDAERVRTLLDLARGGVDERAVSVVRVIALEIWLRALEHRAARGGHRVGARRPAGDPRTGDTTEPLAAAVSSS